MAASLSPADAKTAAFLAGVKALGHKPVAATASPARPSRPAPPRMPRAATRPGAPLPGGAPAAPAVTSPAPVPVVTAAPPATPVASGGGTPPASPPTPPGGGGAGGSGPKRSAADAARFENRITIVVITLISLVAVYIGYNMSTAEYRAHEIRSQELLTQRVLAQAAAAQTEAQTARLLATAQPTIVTIGPTSGVRQASHQQPSEEQGLISVRKGEVQFLDLRTGSKVWFVKNGPAMVQKVECDGNRQSTGANDWSSVGSGQFISPSLGCVLVGVPMYQPNDNVIQLAQP